ncbi:hypothetical protein D3C79_650950 [compost metagenome]
MQVGIVDVGDFQLATWRRLDVLGDVHHIVVVEVQAGHCIRRLGFGGFFFDRQGATVLIEVDHTETLRVFDQVAEHGGASGLLDGAQQLLAETLAMENVVAQNQADRIVSDELFTDQESLGQSVGRGLFGVADFDAELAAVAQQLLVLRQVMRRGNQQDLPNTGQHQHRNRVVDHRFVVDWQQLLGNTQGDGVQAGAGTPRQNDTFGHAIRSLKSLAPKRCPW